MFFHLIPSANPSLDNNRIGVDYNTKPTQVNIIFNGQIYNRSALQLDCNGGLLAEIIFVDVRGKTAIIYPQRYSSCV
jgi:hypothetical protein